jgi:SecD/SecF fusion protein
MQNRNIIWTFTILLALACIYQLSFSWVTSNVEAEALEYAQQQKNLLTETDSVMSVGNNEYPVMTAIQKDEYAAAVAEQRLINKAKQPVYPILGHTYQYCKDNELAKGLDLEGGMSVTLEVSIPDMVKNLAGRSARKNTFAKPYEAALTEYTSKGNEKDFVTIFAAKFNELSPNENLANLFKFKDEQGNKLDKASNEEVLAILDDKAKSALGKTKTIIENRIGGIGVNQPSISISGNRLYIDLPGVKDKERANKLLQGTARLEFWGTYKNTQLGNQIFETVNKVLSDRMYPGYRDSVEEAAADTTKNGDTTLLNSDVAEITDSNNTDLDSNVFDKNTFDNLNNTDLTADEQQEVFRKTSPLSAYLFPYSNDKNEWIEGSVLGYSKLSDTSKVNSYLNKDYVKAILPARDLAFMWEAKSTANTSDGEPLIMLYLIKKTTNGEPLIDGEEVNYASQQFDPTSQSPMVSLQFKSAGATAWATMTELSAKEQSGIAICLDDKVFSAPVASSKIEGGSTQITGGSFSGEDGIQEAKDLANILVAGALPAPARIVDEAIVGSTLGAENVKASLWSFVFALILVLIYMIFYYAKGGIVADLALIANIFFIFGTLASLGAALTLPGIAGIVLTIGMSVDANVLIFERIREELRNGKGNKAALSSGYEKALSAIIDANVTTLLTAIVLAYFGTGAVKGFATTLIIGIFTSLFASLVITRLVFSYMLDAKKEISFSTKLTENIFTKTNWQFIGKRKLFYVVSGLILAGGITSLITKGLDYGVEFTGGQTYKVQFEKEINFEELRKSLAEKNAFGEQPEVKKIDNNFKALITTQYLLEDKSADKLDKIQAAFDNGVTSAEMGKYEIIESRQVAGGISKDFRDSSILAVIFSLLIVFLYIVLRFRKWQFGVGALVAMFHDVLIVLSLFSIFYGILPFSMEIDQAFIAAILTVVGYSINDTVVVFDRIREDLVEHHRDNSSTVINRALNSTLSRTVNTSITTFLVLLVIFLFGGEAIRGMTFALMIGVIVGTYSSLCIATPAVVDLSKGFNLKKKEKL